MKTGIELIAAERERQITAEGWSPEHDDAHAQSELSNAAACYLAAGQAAVANGVPHPEILSLWPWEESWWKPADDPVQNLVKAGALIAAEIDRINRRNDNRSWANDDLSLIELIEVARNQMSDARSTLINARHKHGWRDRIEHVEGLLTCGIGALYRSMQEIKKFEIQAEDKERGQHLKFFTRGIGLDVCPCCFVCGGTERHEGSNRYLNNLAALMASKADGEKIVEWFSGRARLDFRESEPDWIQVKVGACDAHIGNLRALAKATARYGVIREKDIEECKA